MLGGGAQGGDGAHSAFRFSGFGTRVSGSGFRDQGFGFRLHLILDIVPSQACPRLWFSILVFQIFGCRISGAGFRVRVLEEKEWSPYN